ncbi:MAG: NAD(+)/NADH kinase, partial [Actinobacteria bacterium]|nr:NAD(+)/NADH kinase [Actinomycetota bacterium]
MVPGEWRPPSAGQRASALSALVTAAGAAVLVLLGIAGHLGSVLLALAGLLGCTTASWYAVSRRGAVRVLALIAALAGLAAAVTGLVLAAIAVWEVTVVLVLAAGSVAAARPALHRTPRSRWTAPVRGSPPRPDHPVLIMNPRSGGGKAERFGLERECRERGIEPVLLRPGDDLRELAEAAAARGADIIGMAGGDGSQAVVADVAAERGIPYVCVPAGTRNHFALDLGLDRDDVTGALDAFASAAEYRIDLARVNGRVFVNNASLGLYAKVVRSPEYRDAKLRTAAEMLPDLLGPQASPPDLRFTSPDGQVHDGAHLILVSNNPYRLARLDGLGTRERLDCGLLGIVTIRLAGAADVSQLMALQMAGRAHRFSGWLDWRAQRFEVGSGSLPELGVDGEALVMAPPLVFESWPGALRVRVPRPAAPAGPAGRAGRVLTRSAVAA